MMHSTPYLLSVALAGIVLLLVLVIRVRLEPFVSLLLVSAGVALAAGIPLTKIVPDMESGMGAVLAHTAPIVGLVTTPNWRPIRRSWMRTRQRPRRRWMRIGLQFKRSSMRIRPRRRRRRS